MPELKIDIKVDSADGEKKLKSLGDTMDKAGKTGKKGMDDAAGSLGGLRKQTDSAGGGLDGLKKKFESAGVSASTFKGLLGAAGVFGALNMVADGFAAAIRTGAAFEAKITAVGAVTKASRADMAALEKAARDMGTATEFSATQSAGALYSLGTAGFSAKQSIEALPGVIDLATAAQIDLESATDIATSGLNAMGLKISDLAHFNDVLAGVAVRSNAGITDMGYALKYVAPVASQAGYSIEQVGAAIGVMSNAGLKGEMAGTGLSAVFLKLDKATKELGISSNKLPDVLQAIADKQWDATKIAEVFGMEHVKTVNILKSGLSTYKELEEQLKSVDGESKNMADTMRNTVEGSFKSLASAVESFGIDIFNLYRDEVKSSLDAATQFIRDHKDTVISVIGQIDDVAARTMTLGSDLGTRAREMVVGAVNDALGVAEQGKAVVVQIGEEYKRQYEAHMGLLAASQAQKNAAAIADIKRAEAAAEGAVKAQEAAAKKIEKAATGTTRAHKKEYDEQAKLAKKAADDKERAYDRMYKDLGQQADGWKRHEIANLEKQRDEFVRHTKDKELAYKWFAAEVQKIEDDITKKLKDEEEKRAKAAEDALKDRASAYDSMYSDLGTKALGYRDHEVAILGRQRDEFIRHTGDKQLAYAWYADQVKALDKGIADEMAANAALNVGSWAWFEAETGKAMQAIADNGRSALSDGLFSLLKGDMDSLGDAWKGLWDDMLRVMSDILAKMLVEYAISGVGDLISLFSPSSAQAGVGSGRAGGGIVGSIASTAAGKGVGAAYEAAKSWITGGGALAAGTGAAGGAFMGGSALATDIYLGTGALVDAGGAAAAGAGGSGALGNLGALATNPWVWAGAAAIGGAYLIARNNMQPEKREAIDPTDFGWYDQISLNHSADNGGGNAEYGALANQAASDAQRDMARLAAQYKVSIPDDLEGDFQSRLGAMSVHLGGGGMKIREDHLAEDLQVMYRGTLYAMMFDTLDPIYQTLQQYQQRYGVDAGAHMQSNRQLWNRFATFDPEGFWTGADRALFDEYYAYINNAQAFNAAVSARHGGGYASGGLIDRLLVPMGEDGLIGVQYGEGIVSKRGMQALEQINSGNINSGKPPVINVYVGGEKLDARIDYRADMLATKKANRPGMDRRRAVR